MEEANKLGIRVAEMTFVNKLYFGAGTAGVWLGIAAVGTVATGGGGLAMLALSGVSMLLATTDAACAYYSILKEKQQPIDERDKVASAVHRVAKFFFDSERSVNNSATKVEFAVALPMKADALGNIVYGFIKFLDVPDMAAETLGKGVSSFVRAMLAVAVFMYSQLDPVNIKSAILGEDARLTEHLYNFAASLVGVMRTVAAALPPLASCYNIGKECREIQLAYYIKSKEDKNAGQVLDGKRLDGYVLVSKERFERLLQFEAALQK